MVAGTAPTETGSTAVPVVVPGLAGNVRLDGTLAPVFDTGARGDAVPRQMLPTVVHRSTSPRRLPGVPTKPRAGAGAVGLPAVEVHFCRGASVNPASGGALAEYMRLVETGPVQSADADVQDSDPGGPIQFARTAHSTFPGTSMWATEANSSPKLKEASSARVKMRALRFAADERCGAAATAPVPEMVVGTATLSMPLSDSPVIRGRGGVSPETRGKRPLDEAPPFRTGRLPRDPAPERPGGSADEGLMMSSAGALVMRRLVPAEPRRSD